ncbi:MAG: MATE family efflux transporter [Deltaproteobacteria bacterium]|jgi:MATE family multidrug resistance protein|nr:MATE family efflux transporter [Deltaproteobacteria bacterium]
MLNNPFKAPESFPNSNEKRVSFKRLVIAAAFPFCISSGAYTIKITTDRLMLANHSSLGLCAALSGGLAAFMLASLFIGLASYTSILVSQYYGAKAYRQIGPCVWRGLFVSLLAGGILLLLATPVSRIFSLIGHPDDLATAESLYFKILTFGAIFSLGNTALMCFWTGRGKTWTVVKVNLLAILVNIFLNNQLIFGSQALGIPSLGILGAGLATLSSDALKTVLLLGLFLKANHQKAYLTFPPKIGANRSNRLFLKQGLSNGSLALLNNGTLAFFHLIIGLYAQDKSFVPVASGISFTIVSAFLIPLIGLSSAITMLTGQAKGAGDENFLRDILRSGTFWALVFLGSGGLAILCFPNQFISFFGHNVSLTPPTFSLIQNLLGLAIAFLVVEGFGQFWSGAIRGLGAVTKSMKITAFTGLGFFIGAPLIFTLGGGASWIWILLISLGLVRASLCFLYLWKKIKGQLYLHPPYSKSSISGGYLLPKELIKAI